MGNPKDPFRLMAMAILCADYRDFWTNPSADGAIKGPCEELGPEVHLWHLVCVQSFVAIIPQYHTNTGY